MKYKNLCFKFKNTKENILPGLNISTANWTMPGKKLS